MKVRAPLSLAVPTVIRIPPGPSREVQTAARSSAPPQKTPLDHGRERTAALSLLLPFLAGAALRLYQIRDQIIADDEWHALHQVLRSSYTAIFTHFGRSDYCIPLTAWYKLMAEHVYLSEMIMRAPVLLAGLFSLVLVPRLARPFVGTAASVACAWLLAIAPLHIYFSRYARPYGVVMLLAFTGLMAFYRWWSGGGRGWAILYGVCAAIGPYFHLAGAPVLLAPLGFALVECLSRSGQVHRRLHELLLITLAIGAALAALLLPAFIADAYSLRAKTATEWAPFRATLDMTRLLAGVPSQPLLLLWGGGLLAGVISLARNNRRLLALLVIAIAAQIATFMFTRPLPRPVVMARYLSPVLPLLLLFVAAGLASVSHAVQVRIRRLPSPLIMTVVVAVFFFQGPVRATYYAPNAWTNHALFQYHYDAVEATEYLRLLRPTRISPFYEHLRSLPPSSTLVVEAPWYYEWHYNHYPLLQAFHRQRMIIGFTGPHARAKLWGEVPLETPGFAFRNFAHLSDLDRLEERGVRYAILHKDLQHEIPNQNDCDPIDISPWIEEYRLRFGHPCFEDGKIVVFDLYPQQR
ncbi:MAG: hypothetical protein AB1486_20815 [Planctomycetota bacterium]